MKELPRVFANNNKCFNNNDTVSSSKNCEMRFDNKNIYLKIKEIFKSYNYVYKADVVITTDEGVFDKRIIGMNGNYLITYDNEIIDISRIKDISVKEKS